MRAWISTKRAAAVSLALIAASGAATAQERFSPFVGSDPANVERMIKLAGLRSGDVVVDLGSGDGRIVIAAARANDGVRGWGVDVNQKLVRESNAAAQALGLAPRVRFLHRNAFDADLREANVIFMWLWTEVQRLLRTKILAEARPGTRIVTNLWDMGSWTPDQVDENGPPVRLWIVPARLEGYWRWQLPLRGAKRTYSAVLEQRFQAVEGVVRIGNRRGILHDVRLRGEDVSFVIAMTIDGLGYTHHQFAGKARGGRIAGKVSIMLPSETDPDEYQTIEVPWRASRTRTSGYFAPTGLAAP